MLDHVVIHASDVAASQAFYACVLPVVGSKDLVVEPAGAGDPTARLHVGFAAASREEVDRFWAVGAAAGYCSDGEPGERPEYTETYYGAFLLDPDGNSIEAVHHARVRRPPGRIDHIWMRVADRAAAQAFYAGLTPRTGFALREHPSRSWFVGDGGSFTLVEGEPTRHAGLAFEAAERDSLIDPDGNRIILGARARQ